MFCPNCGTENEEAATTCKKCGFNLKGAAAPKFKGTMLMMNAPVVPKPGAPAAAPGVPAPAVAPPPAAPAGAPRPQLKGTMLGVAPPSVGAQTPPPAPQGFGPPPGGPAAPQGFGPAPGAAPQGFGPPPGAAPQGFGPPPGAAPQGYGPPAAPAYQPSPAGYQPPPPAGAPPPAAHGGVNPLGGTMVADAGMGGFNPYAAPNPYGPPPGAPPADPYAAPGGYGTPGPAPGGYGAPAQAQGTYGPPPQQPYGGAQPAGGGYGAPQQAPAYGGAQPLGGGYGPPPAGGYGAPAGYGAPGGFSPPQDQYGMSGSAPMVQMGGGQRGPIGKIRNPILTIVIGMVTCGIGALIQMWAMLNELKAFRGKDDFKPIFMFLPILSIIEGLKMSELVLDAKRMAGVPNPQVAHQIVYLFFSYYLLPSDLNEIWQAASGGQLPPP